MCKYKSPSSSRPSSEKKLGKRIAAYAALMQANRCFWCTVTMRQSPKNGRHSVSKAEWKRVRTADHVIPVSKGGKNDYSNIVAACLGCNSSKGNQVYDFKTILDAVMRLDEIRRVNILC